MPRRGLVDNLPRDPAPPPSFGKFLKLTITKRSLLFVIAGGSLASIGMTAISQFMAIFIQRVHQVGPADAGQLFGIITAISLTIGLLVGSWGADFLARRDRRWWTWGPAIGLFFAPVIYFQAFTADSVPAMTALLITGGGVLLLFYGPTVAMIQNLVEPRMRATGAAFYSMMYAMIGYGFGPPFVGFLSDRFADGAFGGGFEAACPGGVAPQGAAATLAESCATASASGIQQALIWTMAFFFVASACYLVASRTLRRDLHGENAAPSAAPAE